MSLNATVAQLNKQTFSIFHMKITIMRQHLKSFEKQVCFSTMLLTTYDIMCCYILEYSFYGVVVSTADFESADPGSNPGRTFGIFIYSNSFIVLI